MRHPHMVSFRSHCMPAVALIALVMPLAKAEAEDIKGKLEAAGAEVELA